MQLEQHKEIALSLFCAVLDRDRGERVVEKMEDKKSFFNLVSLGRGTANSRILSYLGLGETEKMVFMSILPTHVAREVMNAFDDKFELSRPGHGIAFMTKIYEGCYHKPVQFTGQEDGGTEMEMTATHDLIVVVLNRGYTEEVMDVARAAGATGGTVLHARGCGLSGAEKFFGVTIQPEKEMLWILAGRDISCGIMAEIGGQVGPGTDSNAVSFSMPVSGVKGLGEAMPADFEQA